MMKRIIITLVAVLMLLSQVAAQDSDLPTKEIKDIATKALSSFSQLITRDNYKAMGFNTLEDVRKAKLDDDEPMMGVFNIRLDDLKEYSQGNDPNRLIKASDQAIYPVTVDRKVRTSVEIVKGKEGWTIGRLGGPNTIKLFTDTRKRVVEAAGIKASECFVVQVLSLNLNFIGYRAENLILLAPVLDDKEYDFKAGISIPIKDAINAILPAAQKHDGLPR